MLGEGAGLLDYRDSEAKGTPGEGDHQGLSWGKWTLGKDRITRGKYREAAATKTPRGDSRSSGSPRMVVTSWAPTHRAYSLGPHGEGKGAGFFVLV